ncbi:anti-sigma factor domain-containing protein [Neobacillus pocheonensis]|uniref:Anti-sigma factor domain-containing protein n=1 Tax=Neobacillus pocheonensis TaxID=363869 RepID=A0ABT0WBC1_9BACI|nr:anti-sigma factor domain-containing protein [Neobacillus pocheonensis]
MKKGIVMDIDDAFMTLLTPEGEFLRTRKQNQPYAIGEEINFFPIESHKPFTSIFPIKNSIKFKPVWAVSLMAVFLILLGSFIPMYQNNKAYAYMSIDGNPSIELGINKKMQVIEITGFNKEGKNVISHISNWKNKDVSGLTQSILAEMKKEGYLKNNKLVIISTVRTNQPDSNAEKKLKENMIEIEQTVNKQKLELNVFNGTEKDREKAHEQGLTTGKYQENKIQTSINQKGKEKPNKSQVDKKSSPSQPDESILPPGGLKKQVESGPCPKQ